jgi:hypothetical protein
MARKGGPDIIRKRTSFFIARGIARDTRVDEMKGEDKSSEGETSGRNFSFLVTIFSGHDGQGRPIAKRLLCRWQDTHRSMQAVIDRYQVRINAKSMHVIQSWKIPEVDAGFESVLGMFTKSRCRF